MRNGQPMAPKEALISCALFCDSTLELVDGDPRHFCLVAWRDGDAAVQYTSNLAGCHDRAQAVIVLRNMAKRLERGTG